MENNNLINSIIVIIDSDCKSNDEIVSDIKFSQIIFKVNEQNIFDLQDNFFRIYLFFLFAFALLGILAVVVIVASGIGKILQVRHLII